MLPSLCSASFYLLTRCCFLFIPTCSGSVAVFLPVDGRVQRKQYQPFNQQKETSGSAFFQSAIAFIRCKKGEAGGKSGRRGERERERVSGREREREMASQTDCLAAAGSPALSVI